MLTQQKTHIQQQNESTMADLIAHEADFSKRLDSEAMMALRCKDYEPDNLHWKRVEEMETGHSAIIKNLSTCTRMLQDKVLSSDRIIGGLDDVTKPKKKRLKMKLAKKEKAH